MYMYILCIHIFICVTISQPPQSCCITDLKWNLNLPIPGLINTCYSYIISDNFLLFLATQLHSHTNAHENNSVIHYTYFTRGLMINVSLSLLSHSLPSTKPSLNNLPCFCKLHNWLYIAVLCNLCISVESPFTVIWFLSSRVSLFL